MKRTVNRGVKSQDYILSAPILGLNARDSLSTMKPLFAKTMDNYIPLDNKIALRPGYTMHASIGAPVRTLAAYRKPGDSALIAIAGGHAYNVSSSALVRQYDITFTDSYCQQVQYKNYLYLMNGSDKPRVYYIDADGVEHFEEWSFSGENLQSERIISGAVSKEFLWFIEKDTLKVWYASEAGNISGDLYSFDLSQVVKCGGYLVAVANWTVDGGQGIDDLTVFITSEGEALVYSGSNPNNADDWSLKGSYQLSKPIGYQCVLPYQGDIVIISQDGYIPMGKSLSLSNTGTSAVAFSDAIRGLVLDRTAKNKNKNGWQGIIYSKCGYAIFNVPVAQQFEQHVININTGAWCRFTGIRALCWALYEDDLYFGSDDAVYKFDTGYSDNGLPIEGKIEQAFNNLGTDNLKKIQLLNPRTRSATPFQLVIYTNMDFDQRSVEYYANVGEVGQTKWNEAKWSSSVAPIGTKWSSSAATRIQSQWIADSATGYKVSIVFKTKTKGNVIEWYDTGIRYELGSGIM